MVGLLVFHDPPKADAPESLRALAELGITVKVTSHLDVGRRSAPMAAAAAHRRESTPDDTLAPAPTTIFARSPRRRPA